MRFSEIRLENWRNFPEASVKLQNRAFIVGANASGKSNLLDAFRFLRDLVLAGGGFQKAISLRGGVSALRNLSARQKTDVSLEVALSEGDQVRWRYRIVFNQNNNRMPLVKEERIWKGDSEKPLLTRPNDDDLNDPDRLTQTQLEQTFANREFREIVDFFKTIDYSHIVPQLIRDSERSIGKSDDPYGGDFLEKMAGTPMRSQEARLNRILVALKKAIPQFLDLELQRDEKGVPHLRVKYANWRARGIWQDERDISDGTLRLIGLLWTLQTGDGPLLLEEPELSLHPAVVYHIPAMMYAIQRQQKTSLRQILVSTHSSELLRAEGIEADEVVLCLPTSEGTTIQLGADLKEVVNELNAGLTWDEILIPRTQPVEVNRLVHPFRE